MGNADERLALQVQVLSNAVSCLLQDVAALKPLFQEKRDSGEAPDSFRSLPGRNKRVADPPELRSTNEPSGSLSATLRELDRIGSHREDLPSDPLASSPRPSNSLSLTVAAGKKSWLFGMVLLILIGGGTWAEWHKGVPDGRASSPTEMTSRAHAPASDAELSPAWGAAKVARLDAKLAPTQAAAELPMTTVIKASKPTVAPAVPREVAPRAFHPTAPPAAPREVVPPAARLVDEVVEITLPKIASAAQPATPTPSMAPRISAPPLPVAPIHQVAIAIKRSEPVYPPRARKRGERGMVVLKVLVSETGTISRVLVDRGIPGSDLEAAAIQAVLGWTYSAALEDGRPVPTWVTERIVFEP